MHEVELAVQRAKSHAGVVGAIGDELGQGRRTVERDGHAVAGVWVQFPSLQPSRAEALTIVELEREDAVAYRVIGARVSQQGAAAGLAPCQGVDVEFVAGSRPDVARSVLRDPVPCTAPRRDVRVGVPWQIVIAGQAKQVHAGACRRAAAKSKTAPRQQHCIQSRDVVRVVVGVAAGRPAVAVVQNVSGWRAGGAAGCPRGRVVAESDAGGAVAAPVRVPACRDCDQACIARSQGHVAVGVHFHAARLAELRLRRAGNLAPHTDAHRLRPSRQHEARKAPSRRNISKLHRASKGSRQPPRLNVRRVAGVVAARVRPGHA